MKTDPSFFDKVYEVVRHVPYGRITTYGHIAEYIGAKGASRMVGWAMNASHGGDPPVPAHRVVNRKGLLTGKHHFQTEDMMQRLLTNEGVDVKDDRVVDFEKLLWIPVKEMKSELG
ncbi:MAG: MGMT family protein [Bacteroidetes bacterium]|nr:MGMT family protein [Bacteroidota bacterium]